MRELRGWLLQRLRRPPTTDWEKKGDMIFSFGGGGSGLSKEAWEIVHSLWSFDYMGAAEYEFGAVPKTLNEIVQDRDKLIAYSVKLKAKDIKPSWRPVPKEKVAKKAKKSKTDPVVGPKDTTIFIISREEDRDEVERILRDMAKEKHSTKAYTGFTGAVDPVTEYDGQARGWLDLGNPGGFFLFLDEDMWMATRKAFEVNKVVL